MASFTFYCYEPAATTAANSWSGSWTDLAIADSTCSGSWYIYPETDTTAGSTWSGIWYPETDTAGIYPSNSYVYYEPEAETEEQRQVRLERQAEYRQQQEELRQQQEVANKRAEELLKEYIGVKAFGQLHEVGYIELDSQRYKGRKYRVPENHMAYIEVLDEQGRVIDTLCVHPAIQCPPPDHILTRVIMLQNDEEGLLTAANHWGPRDRSYYEE